MSQRYELEARFILWDNTTGERIEVGDDADGLGMMAIVFVTDDGHRGDELLVERERVPMLIEAMNKWLSKGEGQ